MEISTEESLSGWEINSLALTLSSANITSHELMAVVLDDGGKAESKVRSLMFTGASTLQCKAHNAVQGREWHSQILCIPLGSSSNLGFAKKITGTRFPSVLKNRMAH